MKVDEATQIKNTDIAAYLKLPPVKLHCSMLAEDAIQAAIGDYNKKKQTREQAEQWFTQNKGLWQIQQYANSWLAAAHN